MLRQRASIGLEVVFGCWCSNVDVSGIEWRVESGEWRVDVVVVVLLLLLLLVVEC